MSPYALRRTRLISRLEALGLPGLLVGSESNVHYLTGFTGEDSWLLVLPERTIMLSDARFTTQLEGECPDIDLAIRKSGIAMFDLASQVVGQIGLKRVGFEAGELSVEGHRKLQAACGEGLELLPTHEVVEGLRIIKDELELAELRKAIWYAERALRSVLARVTSHWTEADVAIELEYTIRKLGGDGCSFVPIVAVGARAALPHARASQVKLGADPLLLIDWGARSKRYCSDLTRVLRTARIPPKIEEAYRVVLAAQEAAIAAIAPGVTGKMVDQAARDVIAAAGLGDYFTHGLGHGVGLDIHESPRMGPTSDAILQSGMVITVEPGVYFPGEGGIRIEDDILVTENGHVVLTTYPKGWDDAQLDLGPA